MSYEHLEAREHPWRKQMYVKGRRLTVGQIIGQMRANGWNAQQTADAYDLPREAVAEALDYAQRFADVIAADAAEERRRALGGK